MIESLRPVSAAPMPCKVCGGAAALHGVVDFHKCCEEPRGVRLPLSGVPIYYRRCGACGFLFTDAFDGWNEQDFRTYIYNDSYDAIDPDYRLKRPQLNAAVVTQLWGERRAETRVLDYGGGNDVLCGVLRANGFPAALTYDPMVPAHASRPDGKFELVTCFETLEHMPDPAAGIARIVESVTEPGLVFYTTLVQPADFDKYGLGWWYVGPRNGHVSIFSRQALAIAWARHGFRTVSFNDDQHLAFHTLPAYLAHLDK